MIRNFYRLLEIGDIDAAKKLVTKDYVVGPTFITDFCSLGPDNPELLRYFVELGATNVSPLRDDMWSPLHSVACNDNPKLARELINMGVPIDTPTSGLFKWTPLSKAFQHNGKKTAMVLLDAGAKLSLVEQSHTSIPEWTQNFVSFREKVRQSCVVVLGLLKCRSHVLNGKNGNGGNGNGVESGENRNVNGMDVLRIISRCTWELRGVEFKNAK